MFEAMIEALQISWVAKLTTDTLWGFPINEIIHILSVSVVVGVTVVYAVNTLIQNSLEPRVLRRYATPFFIAAFVIALLTGFVFFAAWPERYLTNTAFLVKLILLAVLLALNTFIWRAHHSENINRTTKVCAWISLIVALATIAAGRLIAYLA